MGAESARRPGRLRSSASGARCAGRPGRPRAGTPPGQSQAAGWRKAAGSARGLRSRAAARDTGRLVGGRLRVAQSYAPFCFPIRFAPIIFALLLLLRHFPNCCFWAELTARSACRCRCLCWSRAAAKDAGRLVGGRCMVAQRYELFCSLICCATITFLHRYALCVYITHPISGQRHFSCRYSDPASSIWGGDIIQESRGDRWCPRCESVVNEVVHVSACFFMFLQYFGEPSLPEGLFAGRHDRALAHAVPPAALPGLIPACGLAREVC